MNPITYHNRLDEAVCEYVFDKGPATHEPDWKYGTAPDDGYGSSRGYWCRVCDGEAMPAAILYQPGKETVHYNYTIWGYSTDARRAETVVAQMHRKGFLFAASCPHPEQWAWVVEFIGPKGNSVASGTFAEAICRAALVALGAPVPDKNNG